MSLEGGHDSCECRGRGETDEDFVKQALCPYNPLQHISQAVA